MNRVERDLCRDNILDIIEALRTNVPEVFFEVKPLKFGEDNYHIEVIASKKFMSGKNIRKKRSNELFTRDHGKLMMSSRIFNMAKELGTEQIDSLHKEYIDDLA